MISSCAMINGESACYLVRCERQMHIMDMDDCDLNRKSIHGSMLNNKARWQSDATSMTIRCCELTQLERHLRPLGSNTVKWILT